MADKRVAAAAALGAAAILLAFSRGLPGQEETDIIPYMTAGIIMKTNSALVLAGKPLSGNQATEVQYKLRALLESAEAEQHELFKQHIDSLRNRKADMKRLESNGQMRKLAKVKEEYEAEKRKIEAIIEKELLRVRDEFLPTVLKADQLAVLGLSKPEEKPDEGGSGRKPARDTADRRLRESDFH